MPVVTEPNSLLNDLYLKKQSILRIAKEIGSMASELREARAQMAKKEEILQQETGGRQASEAEARAMEKEIESLQKRLDEKTFHAISTSSVSQQYLRELVDLRASLGSAQEIAEANAAAAVTARLQCVTLKREIERKTNDLQKHEALALRLFNQIKIQEEATCEKQPKFELHKLEMGKRVVNIGSEKKDSETDSFLEELLLECSRQLSKGLKLKDDEIARSRNKIKLLSSQVKTKAQELEAQIERHRAVEQDLTKKILKFEFWVQEARAQTRKVQKVVVNILLESDIHTQTHISLLLLLHK